ncbi:MAG: hypothetical protein JSS68_10205 [Actinobacteria bacterium]|nr:hypothetical protein [Actinomycetota bacterium]
MPQPARVALPRLGPFAFLSNRTEPLALVEAEHRAHAVVELAIRDLEDQALRRFPSDCLDSPPGRQSPPSLTT